MLHTIFFCYRVLKRILLPRAGKTNPFSDHLVEKKSCTTRENIHFTRVIVALFLLLYQTSQSQIVYCATRKKRNLFCVCDVWCPNKSRVPTRVNGMFSCVAYDFFSTRGSENGFDCSTQINKIPFIVHWSKKIILRVWSLMLEQNEGNSHTSKIIVYDANRRNKYFFHVTHDFYLLVGHKGDFIAPWGANKYIFWPHSGKKSCATQKKTSILIVLFYLRFARSSTFILAKYIFFA